MVIEVPSSATQATQLVPVLLFTCAFVDEHARVRVDLQQKSQEVVMESHRSTLCPAAAKQGGTSQRSQPSTLRCPPQDKSQFATHRGDVACPAVVHLLELDGVVAVLVVVATAQGMCGWASVRTHQAHHRDH